MQKTILITGVSNRFGKDTALTVAAAGHRVFGTVREPAGRNRDAAAELEAKGIDVVVGNPFGGADVNVALKPIQLQLIDGIGMSAPSTLKV